MSTCHHSSFRNSNEHFIELRNWLVFLVIILRMGQMRFLRWRVREQYKCWVYFSIFIKSIFVKQVLSLVMALILTFNKNVFQWMEIMCYIPCLCFQTLSNYLFYNAKQCDSFSLPLLSHKRYPFRLSPLIFILEILKLILGYNVLLAT